MIRAHVLVCGGTGCSSSGSQNVLKAFLENIEAYGLSDKQVVSVKVDTNGRSLVFGDVVVRVNPTFALAMHIDTDECNAAGAFGTVYGEVLAYFNITTLHLKKDLSYENLVPGR